MTAQARTVFGVSIVVLLAVLALLWTGRPTAPLPALADAAPTIPARLVGAPPSAIGQPDVETPATTSATEPDSDAPPPPVRFDLAPAYVSVPKPRPERRRRQADSDEAEADEREASLLFGPSTEHVLLADRQARGITTTLVTADFDNDGDVDIFAGRRGGPNRLYLNLGKGAFRDVTHGFLLHFNYDNRDVRPFDADADGDPDLLLVNIGAPNQLFLNDGEARFLGVSDGLESLPQANAALPLRWDADPALDLAVDTGTSLLIVRNDAGRFRKVLRRERRADVTASLDLDGDGVDELVLADRQQLRVLTPHGETVFDLSELHNRTVRALLVIAQGDERTLLVLTRQALFSVSLIDFPKFDLGKRLLERHRQADASFTQVVAGDLNGDQIAEALLIQPSTVTILDGAGSFARRITRLPASTCALADIDGDRDLDLIVAAPGSDRILVNARTGTVEPSGR